MIEYDDSEIIPHLHHRGGVLARHEPDTLGRILEIANAPGCAPASVIVMRSGVWRTILRERDGGDEEVAALARGEGAIDVRISNDIPMFPGFEIHRTHGSVQT